MILNGTSDTIFFYVPHAHIPSEIGALSLQDTANLNVYR